MSERESGFEYQSEFYPWHLTDKGKDLLLIDRVSGMSASEFFSAVDDGLEKARSPVLLGLIATSIRQKHQDWSSERILRMVDELSLSEVEFINGDAEEEVPRPPVEGEGSPEPSPKSNGSQMPQSETSPAIPLSSSNPG